MKTKQYKGFGGLVKIMKKLRGKNGCPWDRKQTHKTILPYLLEEAYELIEAINKGSKKEMKEELGDLLLQVVFHAQMEAEKGSFDISGVIDGINTKLITRHPHVFAGKKGLEKDFHVRDFWEKHKKETKKRKSVLEGVPSAMPALLRARRLQSKAGSAGFKWKDKKSILKKTEEEFREVKKAAAGGKKKEIEEEVGDAIFALVSLAYFYKIDPEEAVQKTNRKFIKRFGKIEKKINNNTGQKEMLALWEKTKK